MATVIPSPPARLEQKAAARAEDAVKIYGKGQTEKNQGLSVFSVPFLTLLIVIVLAGLAGVAAAVLPSRRAAKLNVLRAIVTE